MADQTSSSGAEALKLLAESREKLAFVAASLTKDRYEQEDLVMRTLERAMSHFAEFDAEKGSLTTWMSTILRNLYASDHRGKARNAVEIADPERISGELSPSDNGTLEEILANSDRDEIRKAVNRLRPEEREAIVMFYFLDLPIARMAKILACPVGTVKSRLARGRAALGEILFHRIGAGRLAMVCLMLLAVVGVYSWGGGALAPTERNLRSSSCGGEGAPTPLLCGPTPLSQEEQDLIAYAKREGLMLYGRRADGSWELATAEPGADAYVAYHL